MRPPLPISLLVLSLGCSLESLSQSWELDRLRVLGVRAVPAEPQPGETTLFESLVYVPEGMELDTTVWFACLPENGNEFGCTLDSDLFEGLSGSDEMTPEEATELLAQLEAAGVIGIEPLWSPSWTPPANALDNLTEEQKLEGVSAMVNLSLVPSEGNDSGDPELAYKRVPVSLATHPNHNPEITGIRVDSETLLPGGHLDASPGAIYEIEPILSEDSIETYTYVDSTGQCEERTEEPYFTWYSEYWYYPGSAEDYADGIPQPTPFTLFPHTSIEWVAPEETFEGIVLVVARDRRGGMAWAHLKVSVP